MPEIVVTLKQQQSSGIWPFVRGTFAWVGFGVVAVVGASILDTPNHLKPAQMIETLRADWRAGVAAYRAQANPYDDIALDPLPNTALGTAPFVNPIPALRCNPSETRK
jgi:hypothetical protein